ncbi:MAG TPA: TIGR03668 family PPOX class F420-dependent oxidoreductase [Thermodesulfobacteriota bacterium]|nr:TIGR03668 family PPOX class F420-dependent oxidoreductase [Thermodesulfobacteriota bacterium]
MHVTPSASEIEILLSARVARMATATPGGEPLVVPVCFVYTEPFIYTPLDKKPKKTEWKRLRRVKNISANPSVSLVIDEYSEDWRNLYYLIINGRAGIISGGSEYEASLRALSSKYPQYKEMGLEDAGLPVIRITPVRIISWGSP